MVFSFKCLNVIKQVIFIQDVGRKSANYWSHEDHEKWFQSFQSFLWWYFDQNCSKFDWSNWARKRIQVILNSHFWLMLLGYWGTSPPIYCGTWTSLIWTMKCSQAVENLSFVVAWMILQYLMTEIFVVNHFFYPLCYCPGGDMAVFCHHIWKNNLLKIFFFFNTYSGWP